MDVSLAIKVGGSADQSLAGDAASVEVHERMGEPTTFKLRYQVDIDSGDLPRLADGRIDPGSELQILALLDGQADCLVHGFVHGQQIRLLHGGAGSYVDVMGSDSSIKMDREVKQAVWTDQRDSDAVRSIVGTYGFDADIEDTDAKHLEKKHALVQHDSDLRFVRRLARRNGCLFWLSADPLGKLTAHFRRPPVGGSTAAKLVINLDSPTMNTVDLAWEVERPTSTEIAQLDLSDKGVLDGAATQSPLASLGDKSLADLTGDTRSAHVVAPADDAGDLKRRSEGTLIEAGWFIRATGETSANSLGKVLHAHSVVELHGAGKRHTGKYFVAGVRHLLDAATYRMEFELLRNAWGA